MSLAPSFSLLSSIPLHSMICLSIHLSMDICICFQSVKLLQIKQKWAFMDKSLYGPWLSFLFIWGENGQIVW